MHIIFEIGTVSSIYIAARSAGVLELVQYTKIQEKVNSFLSTLQGKAYKRKYKT